MLPNFPGHRAKLSKRRRVPMRLVVMGRSLVVVYSCWFTLFLVDVSSVSDLHHVNDKLVINYLVEDSVVTLSDSIFFLTGQLLAAKRVWILCKTSDFLDNANSIFLLDSFDFLRCRLLDDNSIAFHFSLGRLRMLQNR